ncbi:MAG: TolC family protein, partial [Candidatus Binataceae bacterium]
MARILTMLIGAVIASAVFATAAVASAAETRSDAPLTLNAAINRALAYAPAADVAIAQADFSDAKVNEARAPLFPNVALNGEYNQAPGYSQIITNRGMTLAQLALDYTVFDGGRRSADLRAARYSAQATRLGVNAARSQIVFATTVAYFDLQRARATASELRRSRERLAQDQTIVENLRGSGRANAGDVLKIRSVRDAAELALAAADQAAEHAAIVLGSLVGAPAAADLRIAEVTDLPPQPGGEIASSPVFRAAERQLEAAHSAVAAAGAERLPTVRLALTSGFEGID